MAEQSVDTFWNMLRDQASLHIQNLFEFLVIMQQERIRDNLSRFALVIDESGTVAGAVPVGGENELPAPPVEDEVMLREGVNYLESLIGNLASRAMAAVITEIRRRRRIPQRKPHYSRQTKNLFTRMEDFIDEVRDQMHRILQDFLESVVREAIRNLPTGVVPVTQE